MTRRLLSRTRRPPRPLRTSLPLLLTAILVCVCGGLGLTTVLAQHAYLTAELDGRVSDAAEYGVTGAARRPERPADLTFLGTGGHPCGLLAARFDTGGEVLTAAVVRPDDRPRALTAAQRSALTGVPDEARPTPVPSPASAPTVSPPSTRAASASWPACPRTTYGTPSADSSGSRPRPAASHSLSRAAAALSPYGGTCARSAGSPPPPPGSPGRRSNRTGPPSSPASPHPTPTPARSVPPSTG
ncbi:hypothetical protein AV521_39055 [Streptomyces sp. IMTB 2501]|uniref:hypothetical protein n=1 Tax=Streptomyces sp. IMTB 2501 TaxID=1776340 RepID=UPI00096F55B3|nr:hypothetical protein [Streptomyces sp. IMTB 2501]OLZ63364.1 hypothetical protein AV521_39055 [Streptomyces sp. IMTB 2501]